MVKIYTRKGDDGTTSLWYGGRIDKHDARTEAYGTLDESNSALGLARSLATDSRLAADLLRLQTELFVAGAELATAAEARELLLVARRLGVRLREEHERPALFRNFDDLIGTMP